MGRKGTQQPVPVADMLVDAVSKWEAQRGAGWKEARENVDKLTSKIADGDALIASLTDVRAQLVQEKDACRRFKKKRSNPPQMT